MLRVKIVDFGGQVLTGTFLGLIGDAGCDRCSSDTPSAVVRLDEVHGHGLFLTQDFLVRRFVAKQKRLLL